MTVPHIEGALVLSTCHVPKPDPEEGLGFRGPPHPRCSPHEHGWIVFLLTDDDRSCPDWFRPIMVEAVTQKVSFVIFDSTGQILNQLPSYDW